ncbi:WD40-repeat-containing domain protein [Polychytrium aggregatum]|uniref:WD40-repeat-containing domain protein n=1 Tax=Polychytrium aggregatum TaxID=110093 RepID=UPI0022FDD262|nr:WD40-repeat-containing domain protein [Polychytrium aggregatum]KAI9206596.1 WD40-repeat-containing domain protein [Polychytrium aggregatum]
MSFPARVPLLVPYRRALSLFLWLSLCLVVSHAQLPPVPSNTLVFSDDFDSDQIDTTKWNVRSTCNDPRWNGVACYTDDPSVVFVSNGSLVIRPRLQSLCVDTACASIASAWLDTDTKFSLNMGRFELRAKVPPGASALSAFWLLINSTRAAQLNVPAAYGELDVMIVNSSSNSLASAIWANDGFSLSSASAIQGSIYSPSDADLSDDFHLYWLEWSPNLVVFGIDNITTFTNHMWAVPRFLSREKHTDTNAFTPSLIDYFLVLNLAIVSSDPGSGGAGPNGSASWGELLIDHVRTHLKQALSMNHSELDFTSTAAGPSSPPCDDGKLSIEHLDWFCTKLMHTLDLLSSSDRMVVVASILHNCLNGDEFTRVYNHMRQNLYRHPRSHPSGRAQSAPRRFHFGLPPTISDLPNEVLSHIFTYLHSTPSALATASAVSRHWNQVVRDDILWKRLCRARGFISLDASSGDRHKLLHFFSWRERNPIRFSDPGPLSETTLVGSPFSSSLGLIYSWPWRKVYKENYLTAINWTKGHYRTRRIAPNQNGRGNLAIHFDDAWVVSVVNGEEGNIQLWNMHTGHSQFKVHGHQGFVSAVKHVISGGADRTIKIWDSMTGQTVKILHGHSGEISCIQSNGATIVSGSEDQTIRVWRFYDGLCTHILRGHTGAICCLQACGSTIVSGSTDHTIRVWSTDLAMDPALFDDSLIVSGSDDMTIKVWDVATGEIKRTLEGHLGGVVCLQFDKQKIVSGSSDNTIKVWTLASGQCLYTLKEHSDTYCNFAVSGSEGSQVWSLRFTRNKLLSSSFDRSLLEWDFTFTESDDLDEGSSQLSGSSSTDISSITSDDGDD